jgi:hypothetical protein
VKEDLFHQIWVRFAPEFRHLTTSRGEIVEVLNPGTLNFGDGPDFHLGSIQQDGYMQYGDIELHVRCSDWYAHKHQHDPAYNTVILHVVLDEKGADAVLREDGTRVPTVVVGHQIPSKLLSTIRESVGQHELRCRNVIRTISPSVIERQLEIAAELYLAQKKKQLLGDFETSLRPSEAWLKMVFVGWARGLGIPTNSHQLEELAGFMWDNIDIDDISALREKIGSIRWDHSGSRPGNRPQIRFRQLQHLLHELNQDTFRSFVTGKAESIFEFFDTPHFGGQDRRLLLQSIVIAPALSILTDITGKSDFERAAHYYWNHVGFKAPYSIKQPFRKAGIAHLKDHHSPGLVYQYKHFCKNKACDRCLIFKNAVGG